MFIRLFLVGAVASLGFDLPQGIDAEALARSGRIWWDSRIAEFEARHGIELTEVEGTPSPEPAAEVEAPPPDPDVAFSTVIEDVVAAFAADGISDGVEEPEAPSQLVAGVEEIAYGPEFADALNRWADGLSEPAEPAMLADEAGTIAFDSEEHPIDAPILGFAGSAFASTIDTAHDVPVLLGSSADESADDLDDDDGDGPDGRGEQRLATAVQLTGQALQAWLALAQPDGPTMPPAL